MPDELAQRIVDVHGARGRAWLDELPERIAACERRWSLAVGDPFPNLSYHWVAPASRQDGSGLVLKLGVPNPELTSQIDALRAWEGRGSVHLVEADAVEGVILLERLLPGSSLAEPDDESIAIALDVMQRLHAVTPPPSLPSLADWTRGLERAHAAGFEPALVSRALTLREQLLASAPQSVLLHGDLHHDNILLSERGWLAIDPKGVVGDPAYEPATFLYNPPDRLLGSTEIGRRVDRFAVRLDRSRVVGWAVVQAVLSAWWTFEDHRELDAAILRFAEIIWALR